MNKRIYQLKTWKWILFLPIYLFCGCAGTMLKHDFSGYNEVYADSSERQLLETLARLANNEPVNFMQLASISSQYQLSSSASFAPSATRTDPANVASGVLQHILTFGGTLTAGATQTPVFQYVPINGTNLVQAVMSPISDKAFYTFYDQGFPADLLARIMIASVEKDNMVTNNFGPPIKKRINIIFGDEHIESVETNVSDPKYDIVGTNTVVLVNNPSSTSYADFLEYCDTLRTAQLRNRLIVGPTTGTTTLVFSNKTVKLNDVVAALGSGLDVRCDADGNIIVAQKTKAIGFVPQISPSISGTQGDSAPSNASSITSITVGEASLKSAKALMLSSTLSSDDQDFDEKGKSATKLATEYASTNFNFNLKMRTFESAMYGVAQQQYSFHALVDPSFATNLSKAFERTVILNRVLTDERTIFDKLTGSKFAQTSLHYNYLMSDTNHDVNPLALHMGAVILRDDLSKTPGILNTIPGKDYANILRALENYIDAVANITNRIYFSEDKYGPFALVRHSIGNSYFKVRPAMTLTFAKEPDSKIYRKNVELSFRGTTYYVGDFNPDGQDGQRQNRTAFTLLSYLFSQTAISSQNLPVQQLIQVQ